MTSLWLTLPTVGSLLVAVLLFFFRTRTNLVNAVSVLGALAQLIIAGLLVLDIINFGPTAVAFGQWMAPFGIVFVADLLSVSLVMITAIIGLVVVVYAIGDLKEKPSYGSYHGLIHVLLSGVYGAFLTGDIFNLYVWFEVMLIGSFGLMVLDGSKAQIDGAVKYVLLNLISTLAFLLAIGLVYGATGTLNLADLHFKMSEVEPDLQRVLAVLLLFSFAIKSALFPLFSWLPASYHTLPSAVVALFAALLTKVGVYVFLRIYTLIFPLVDSGLQPLLIWVAGLTMLSGVLGAASQFDIKKILSFHIISQIGYMLMGLAIFTPIAIAGAIFYVIHHILVKANLFLIGGVLQYTYGSSELNKLGGAYKSSPLLSFLFIVPAFSLAGFPPLSGFWGKFLVIKASIDVELYLLASVALFVGLLTIYSMTKIWSEAFWKPDSSLPINEKKPLKIPVAYLLPIATLTTLSLIIGLFAEPFFQFAMQASEQLLQPTEYLQAVLEEGV
ncbi:proton-conducting transporter transmembrane domain-containing protein [Vibrio superstes]|uniref:NADH dehydrogenase n=1 Tax=Vibrio superstes NBRC 103154 TaxID=1219062 RepID=A0A511QPL6_9VIBR|nr:proton-conducting transporter membrane subunit [Vibrio superstes]GEM79281.1 NADH dehydrogenase [Vibrio superstes NBRC 103154]